MLEIINIHVKNFKNLLHSFNQTSDRFEPIGGFNFHNNEKLSFVFSFKNNHLLGNLYKLLNEGHIINAKITIDDYSEQYGKKPNTLVRYSVHLYSFEPIFLDILQSNQSHKEISSKLSRLQDSKKDDNLGEKIIKSLSNEFQTRNDNLRIIDAAIFNPITNPNQPLRYSRKR